MKATTLSLQRLRLRRKRRNGGKVGRWLIGHGVRFQRGYFRIIQPNTTRLLMPFVSPVRWCRVDKNRFLVGDIVGRLAMLVYTPPSGLTLLPLGEVSSPSVISKVLLIDHLRLPPLRLSRTLLPKWSMLDPIWRTRC